MAYLLCILGMEGYVLHHFVHQQRTGALQGEHEARLIQDR